MKRFNVLLVVLLCITAFVNAQVPQKFSYQAVLRNADGSAIKNTDVTVRASLLKNAANGSAVYSETHEVTTSGQGLVALSIGGGNVASGLFTQIPWENNIFLKIEVKVGSNDYVDMGTTQVLSVPYSIRAEKSVHADTATYATTAGLAKSLQNGMIEIAPAAGHAATDPIFSVKNANGEVVFAVFEDGVRSYVNSLSSTTVGGFVVAGLADGNPNYFMVSPDSTRVYVDNSAKASGRSGFAVGGRSGQKSAAETYLSVTPSLTEVYFDTTAAKATGRTGFAVGGRSGQKSTANTYLAVAPTLTEVYFDNSTTAKASGRSGFAVGGRSGQKGATSSYLEVTPSITSVYVDETAKASGRSGFAVGGRAGQKGTAEDILFVSTDSTRVYINDNNATKGGRSGFAVGGRSGQKSSNLNYLTVTSDSTRIVVGNTTTKASNLGGFTVGGVVNGTFSNFLTVTDKAATFNTNIHSEGSLLVSGSVNQNTGVAQDSLTDSEGNKYATVKIGKQVWMAQNLRTMKTRLSSQLSEGSVYLSTTDVNNIGAYYKGTTYIDSVCPAGWALPSVNDYSELFKAQGGSAIQGEQGLVYTDISEKLLSANGSWIGQDITNVSGFSAFATDLVTRPDTTWLVEEPQVKMATFWTSNYDASSVVVVTFKDDAIEEITMKPADVTTKGYNIRCIKK